MTRRAIDDAAINAVRLLAEQGCCRNEIVRRLEWNNWSVLEAARRGKFKIPTGQDGRRFVSETAEQVTLTEDQQDEIEDYIDRGWKTRDIIRATGHSEAMIREGRRVRTLRRACERTARHRNAEPEPEHYATPAGDLLAALRAHMPLASGLGAWLRDDAALLLAEEDSADIAKRPAPSLRELRLPGFSRMELAA